MQRLLEGSPDVLVLFSETPFGARPSKYVRALLYDYHFADARSPGAQRQWWARQLGGTYYPSSSLADFQAARPTGGGIAPVPQ